MLVLHVLLNFCKLIADVSKLIYLHFIQTSIMQCAYEVCLISQDIFVETRHFLTVIGLFGLYEKKYYSKSHWLFTIKSSDGSWPSGLRCYFSALLGGFVTF